MENYFLKKCAACCQYALFICLGILYGVINILVHAFVFLDQKFMGEDYYD